MKKSSKKDPKKDYCPEFPNINPIIAKELFTALNPTWEKEIREGREWKDCLLGTMLKWAVPIKYCELKDKTLEYVQRRQKAIASTIGTKGDILLYGSKKKGECAAIFVEFSEGVTILAMLSEGGVEMFGSKFDYQCPKHWNKECC